MNAADPADAPTDDRLAIELGRLKEIRAVSPAAKAALERYTRAVAGGADLTDRKALLCALIDAVDGEIFDEWAWTTISKDDAKRQVAD